MKLRRVVLAAVILTLLVAVPGATAADLLEDAGEPAEPEMPTVTEEPEEETVYYAVAHGKDITLVEAGPDAQAQELMEKSGYDPEDYLYETESLEGQTTLVLYDALRISVTADGETKTIRVTGGTLGEILDLMGIALGEEDIISHDVSSQVFDGMDVRINRVTYGGDYEEVPVPFATKYSQTDDMYVGEEKEAQPGEEGVKRLNYRVRFVDGVESSRELVSEEIVKEPVNRIIAVGTKEKPKPQPAPAPQPQSPAKTSTASGGSSGGKKATVKKRVYDHTVNEVSGTVTAADGTELSYSRTVSMYGTAYTYTAGSITSSGAPVQVGIVAALPSTLAPGTRVYIVSEDGKFTYGPAVVGDTPGGDIIDLFYETVEECASFGVRRVLVYVLD